MSASRRRGALLPAVLAIMVLIGLAASAGFFMLGHERSAGASAQLETIALAATDDALIAAAQAFGARARTLRVGGSYAERIAGDGKATTELARILRLGETLFALHVDVRAARASAMTARRRATVLLRLNPPALPFPAALSLDDGGPAPPGFASDVDSAPAGWSCPPDEGSAPDSAQHPPLATDTAAVSDLRLRADFSFRDGAIVASPDPRVDSGECSTADANNWGDASRSGPCAHFFPIVHGTGDLTVDGGSGQGVLVVDGDLRLSGGFAFTGAVIVSGALIIGPGGASVLGGVRAASVSSPGEQGSSEPVVIWSTCALRTALLATAQLAPLRERPWMIER